MSKSIYFVSGYYTGNFSGKLMHFDVFIEYDSEMTSLYESYEFRKVVKSEVMKSCSVKEDSIIEIHNIVKL